jgi:O-acetyl-ADP-ribose deacetylase (regulator of RNase III)
LKAADEAGIKSVSLPAMRTGVMMGVVEKTAQATVDEMAAGVRAFAEAGPKSIKNIKFGVYNNPDIEERLFKALADK